MKLLLGIGGPRTPQLMFRQLTPKQVCGARSWSHARFVEEKLVDRGLVLLWIKTCSKFANTSKVCDDLEPRPEGSEIRDATTKGDEQQSVTNLSRPGLAPANYVSATYTCNQFDVNGAVLAFPAPSSESPLRFRSYAPKRSTVC